MTGRDYATDEQLKFRLGRMANCMKRLLNPDFSAEELNWLVERVVGTDQLIAGGELLPITRFRTENQANAVWERVAIDLDEHGIGPGNVRTDVDAIFEELALNAAQHSQAQDSCYGVVEMSQYRLGTMQQTGGEILYIIGISDGGIGIPSSLRQNPLHAHILSDKDAILRATNLDVTGTTEQRGAGLHHVLERVTAYAGELVIISGHGFLKVSQGGNPVVDNLSEMDEMFHYGTLVLATLSVPAQEMR